MVYLAVEFLGFPKYVSGPNSQKSPCVSSIFQWRPEGNSYQHKTESHMRITEPFVSIFQSLQITEGKGWKSWGAKRDALYKAF
jgi:hypothetical protein